jgi:hypothetical protein
LQTGQSLLPSANLWGYYDIYLDLETNTIQAVPNRSTEFAANVVKFLNNDPQGLKVKSNGVTPGPGYVDLDVDITIKHPLSTHEYDGYDVRGIFVGNGTSHLQYNDKLVFPAYGTDQIVLNADGYTRWFNPTEFLVPKLFGYIPGKLASPGYTGTATLNPYRYFGDGLGTNEDLWGYLNSGGKNIGYFLAGTSNTRNYKLRFPTPLPGIKYGYAVVANWSGAGPQYHPSHAPEAVGIRVEDNSTLYYIDDSNKGGDLVFDISIFDWDADLVGGQMQDYDIFVESTVLSAPYHLTGSELVPTANGDHWFAYHVEVPADNVKSAEGNEMWIAVQDAEADYANPPGPPNSADGDSLAACFRFDLAVSSQNPAWIHVLSPDGGEQLGIGNATEITWDSFSVAGNVNISYSKDNFTSDIHSIVMDAPNIGSYVWDGIPDDPSNTVRVKIESSDNPGVYDVSDNDFSIMAGGWAVTWDSMLSYAEGIVSDEYGYIYVAGDWFMSKAFLRRYDPAGQLVWERIWGSESQATGLNVAMDDSGYIYVTGYFRGDNVDFDPGPGTDLHSYHGSEDIFLSKFDSSGNYIWGRSWGGDGVNGNSGTSIAVKSADVYVAGYFCGKNTDFDPGPGTDLHSTINMYDVDCFLTRFDASGNYVWAGTWGGSGSDMCLGAAMGGSGRVFVTGVFSGIDTDFDPDPVGECKKSANGFSDAFLSGFDGNTFLAACTWGGSDSDRSYDVAVDNSGAIYVTGYFMGTDADLDPGAGSDLHSSLGEEDTFLIKFDSSASFQWARTWGGTLGDLGQTVAVDGSGNVICAGAFQSQSADFDPGSGTDLRASNGDLDAFWSKFNSSGDYLVARTWGGKSFDWAESVSVSGPAIYVAGYYSSLNVQFAPVGAPCFSHPDVHSVKSEDLSEAYLVKYLPGGCW